MQIYMEGRSSKRARKSCKIVHVKFLQNDFTVDLRSGQLALPTFVRTSGEMYGTGCVICTQLFLSTRPGLSSLGVPGVPWHPQILADQLTLSQPEGAVYAHQIILAPPDFQTFLWPCRQLYYRTPKWDSRISDANSIRLGISITEAIWFSNWNSIEIF